MSSSIDNTAPWKPSGRASRKARRRANAKARKEMEMNAKAAPLPSAATVLNQQKTLQDDDDAFWAAVDAVRSGRLESEQPKVAPPAPTVEDAISETDGSEYHEPNAPVCETQTANLESNREHGRAKYITVTDIHGSVQYERLPSGLLQKVPEPECEDDQSDETESLRTFANKLHFPSPPESDERLRAHTAAINSGIRCWEDLTREQKRGTAASSCDTFPRTIEELRSYIESFEPNEHSKSRAFPSGNSFPRRPPVVISSNRFQALEVPEGERMYDSDSQETLSAHSRSESGANTTQRMPLTPGSDVCSNGYRAASVQDSLESMMNRKIAAMPSQGYDCEHCDTPVAYVEVSQLYQYRNVLIGKQKQLRERIGAIDREIEHLLTREV